MGSSFSLAWPARCRAYESRLGRPIRPALESRPHHLTDPPFKPRPRQPTPASPEPQFTRQSHLSARRATASRLPHQPKLQCVLFAPRAPCGLLLPSHDFKAFHAFRLAFVASARITSVGAASRARIAR